VRVAVLALTFSCGIWAQNANQLFDDTVLHDVHLYVHPVDWQTLIDNFWLNTYYPAEMSWRGLNVSNIGIRARGGGSRNPRKPGLKVDFNRYDSNQRFLGLTSIILDNSAQDNSFLAERLSMLLFRKRGIAAPREAYARLFLNNRYFGLYSIVEEVNADFSRANFNTTGDLYEFRWIGVYRFGYLGDDPEPYAQIFKAENNAATNNLPNLIDFIRFVNTATDVEFEAGVGRFLDVEWLLKYLAIESYIGEWDGFLGSEGMNNFYLFRAPGGLYRWIPWDKDVTMTYYDLPLDYNKDQNVLAKRLMSVPAFRRTYYEELAAAQNEAGGEGGFLATEIERAFRLMHSAALADPTKGADNEQFEEAVEAVRNFVQFRWVIVRDVLKEMADRP